MTLSAIIRLLGRLLSRLRDLNSIARGRVLDRIWNKEVGRTAGRLARPFFRRKR